MTASPPVADVSAPMPWQAEAWSRLSQQLKNDQLPHALLISGPQYIGKARLATALARMLLCQAPVDGLNCGKCHPCALSASGTHGDFRWLEPEGKSRAVKIDQIRALVDFCHNSAGFGLRKLVVITPAESMNTSAANALLKLLEEPAANTYLILVCHRIQGLPATIRSRCQLLRLGVPAQAQSLAWLEPACGSREESVAMLELAGERPLLAEQLYGEPAAEHLRLARLAMAALFAGKSGVAPLAKALATEKLEDSLVQLVAGLQALLRGLDGERLASAQSRAGFRLIDEIQQIQRAINGGSNPNPQLLLEAMLAKVQRVLGDGGLSDSIEANVQGAPQ